MNCVRNILTFEVKIGGVGDCWFRGLFQSLDAEGH